ncbi:CMT1A duplicated region transcript 1 protein-like [Branchiostoma floridae]|uniref:CMT1A duplicated region transcript 1 protein-like n=1 Tax=Branchiostoma floridae TaxID=7739 RepID=A0A9J7KU35_BRAFL|nr:CMT1A duplicated region transcript 1 protein-like [Branchiostoma floridae]
MKHPPDTTEVVEFNLGRAPTLRCTSGQPATTCGHCEACRLGATISFTREWFLRAGDHSKRRFLLGLPRRFHSAELMEYVVSLLSPLLYKDYTYARCRTNPSLPGDSSTLSGDRALNRRELRQHIADTWAWFAEASYWSKANYMLGVMQFCEPQMLYSLGTQARTMLQAQKNMEPKGTTDWEDDESLASSNYTYNTEEHPDLYLLTQANLEYATPTVHPITGDEFDPIVINYDEDVYLSDDSSEFSSIDPTCMVLPTSVTATAGVAKYRDFISGLPVHLSKYILGFLDRISLYNCLAVGKTWRVLAEQVQQEEEIQIQLWEEVLFYQGSSARGCNPVYAKQIDVAVPILREGTLDPLSNSGQPMEVVTHKDDVSFLTAYSGMVTRPVTMEERNVYCGAYNVMVLADQDDPHRRVHHDGKKLVALGSVDRKVRILDVMSGREHRTPITGHAGSIKCVYISEERGFVLSGSYDTTVRCWSLQAGNCLRIFRGHRGTITCIDLFENRLVSGSKDSQVKVWNFETGKCQRTFKHKKPILAVGILADRVVSGCDGGQVKVWSISAATLVKKLSSHQGPVTCLKFDQWHLVTGGKDGYAFAWSMMGTHSRCLTAFRHPRGSQIMCLQFLFLRVITGCSDGKMRIFNLLSGDCLRVLRGNSHSDAIDDIIVCENRLLINTINNLLVFTFEEIEWDYSLDSDKVEVLKHLNNYSDAPFKQHPYVFVRGQRMRQVGASSEKVYHRSEPAYSPVRQLPHSARSFSQQSLSSAKRIHSAKMRTTSQPTPTLIDMEEDPRRAGSPQPPTRRQARSPDVTSNQNLCLRSTQTPTLSSPTGFRLSTARGASAPAGSHRNVFFESSDLSLSEMKSQLRSRQRVQKSHHPSRDEVFMCVGTIHSSIKDGEANRNMVINSCEINPKIGRPQSSPAKLATSKRAETAGQRTASRMSSTRHSHLSAVPSTSVITTQFQSVPVDTTPHTGMHDTHVVATVPQPSLLRPQTSLGISRDPETFQKLSDRPNTAGPSRGTNLFTTSGKAAEHVPMIVTKSLQAQQRSPNFASNFHTVTRNPVDPLRTNVAFKLKTIKAQKQFESNIVKSQTSHTSNKEEVEKRGQRRRWLAVAKGLSHHNDMTKTVKKTAYEIGE